MKDVKLNIILVDREEKYVSHFMQKGVRIKLLIIDDISKNKNTYKESCNIECVYTLSEISNISHNIEYDLDFLRKIRYAFDICDYGSRRILDDYEYSHFDFVHVATFWKNYISLNKINCCIICNLYHGFSCDYLLQEVALLEGVHCYHIFYPNYNKIALFNCNKEKIEMINRNNCHDSCNDDIESTAHYEDGFNYDFKEEKLKLISKITYKIGGAYAYRVLTLIKRGGYFIDHRFCTFASYIQSCRKLNKVFKLNRKSYDKVDFAKKYIIFFLHFEPEAVIANFASEIGTSQLAAIEMISSAIPDDWVLYVKEHPDAYKMNKWQMEFYRPVSASFMTQYFFEKICSFENVQLIDYHISASELIEHAMAVSTIAGTVATEAIIRSKPLIMFNSRENIYKIAKECLCANNTNEISRYCKCIENGFIPNYSSFYIDRMKILLNDNDDGRKKIIENILDLLEFEDK